MENLLLIASLVGTAAFGCTFIFLAVRKPPAPTPTPDEQEALRRGAAPPTAQELGEMAEKFSKSGPQATAASLTVFFFTAALLAGGILDVSLDAGGDDATAAATQ